MRSRILFPVLSVMVLILASLACSLPGATSSGSVPAPAGETPAANNVPASGGGSGACNNPLYPVVVGASWSYSFTGAAPGNFTRSITAVNADGFTDQDVFASGISRAGEWKCNAGSLIALKPDSGASNATAQSQNVSADFKTTSMDGVTLPGKVNPGDKWSQNFTMEGTVTVGGRGIAAKDQVAFSCTAAGTESVTVPAGTFNAVHMDCTSNITIIITMNGTDAPRTVSTTSTMWYAPGVGMVKSDNVINGSGNSTLELTAYHIP